MKKFLLLAALAVVFLAAPHAHAASAAMQGSTTTPCTQGCTAIQTNWVAPSPQPLPLCTATLTTNCFLGYQEVLTPPAGSGGAVTTIAPCTPAQQAAPPNTCIPASVTTYTWAPGGPLFYGSWGIALYSASAGATAGVVSLSTTADSITLAYALPSLNPPTGLTATPSTATSSSSIPLEKTDLLALNGAPIQ
jgi:hypothetical protein